MGGVRVFSGTAARTLARLGPPWFGRASGASRGVGLPGREGGGTRYGECSCSE